MLLELHLDKFLIVKDFLEVFLGVVVELDGKWCTIMRKSLNPTPSLVSLPPLEKNLYNRLIFSFSEDLKILAACCCKYLCL